MAPRTDFTHLARDGRRCVTDYQVRAQDARIRVGHEGAEMKSTKAKVVASVLGSAATIITLASVVGAGTKWQ